MTTVSNSGLDSVIKQFPTINEETRKISVALAAHEAGTSLQSGFLPYAFACYTLIEKSTALRKAHKELDAALQELSGKVQVAYEKIAPSDFYNAIQANDVKTVEKILKISNFQNRKLPNGELPLHYAIRSDSVDVVKYLLETTRLNPLALDHQGLSAFDHAFLGKDPKMIALAMSAALGKDIPKSALTEEISPLDIHNLYSEMKRFQRPPIAFLPPLHASAFLGDIPSLEKLIRETDINTPDANGMTALHYALLNGRVDAVKWLLQKKAKLDTRAANGMNAIHFAVMNGSENLLKLLLEQGKIDLNAADGRGRTPLHFALVADRLTLARALIEKGADPLIQTMQMTPVAIFSTLSKLRALDRDPLKMEWSSLFILASFVSAATCRYFQQYDIAAAIGALPIFGQLINVSFISKSHPLMNLGARIGILPALHSFIQEDLNGKVVVQGMQTAWLGKKWFDHMRSSWNNSAVETYRPLRNALIHTANVLLSGVELLYASEILKPNLEELERIFYYGKKLKKFQCTTNSAHLRPECKRVSENVFGLNHPDRSSCKKAYRELGPKTHPDKMGGSAETQTILNSAYEVLDSCNVYPKN